MSLVRDQIHTDIRSQFPSFYNEYGDIFISFMDYYYEYVDNLENNFRSAFEIRDVDTTFERFLTYFKEKYMVDLPELEADQTRFILKHIQDFYKRKGSEESAELFFRMFFNEDIEIIYPSRNVLRISDSKYTENRYLEMFPVYTIRDYPIRKGDNIKGTITQAEAYVDQIIFKSISGAIVPIVYLSNLYNDFSSQDGLIITGIRNGGTETVTRTQRIIYGSISQTSTTSTTRTPNNKVGDTLELISSLNGQRGKAIVTEISDIPTGDIRFTVEDSGFGFTSNSTVEISNQVLVVYGDEIANTLPALGAITANNEISYDITSNTEVANTFSGDGVLIAYEHPLIYLKTDSANTAFDTLTPNSYTSVTIEGYGEVLINSVSAFPDAVASFEITDDDLTNVEDISIIVDRIGDYANVTIDSADYGMSGANTENANTRLVDAFTPLELTIGSIATINATDVGSGYASGVRTYVEQVTISEFDKRDIGIIFSSPSIVVGVGDIATQTYDLEVFDPLSSNGYSTVEYTAKAEFLRRSNEVFYFRPITFHGFDESQPISLRSQTLSVENILIDTDSSQMGLNALIDGEISDLSGQIVSIKITDTGFRYTDGEEVELRNVLTGETVGTATVVSDGTGYGEGRWETSTSFLNEPTKVIQDSYYYQEYSYDISSIIDPNKFVDVSKDAFHVAGTKQFTSYLINSQNTIGPEVDSEIDVTS